VALSLECRWEFRGGMHGAVVGSSRNLAERAAEIERLIDGRVTGGKVEQTRNLPTSCSTLTRRTRNTFFALL